MVRGTRFVTAVAVAVLVRNQFGVLNRVTSMFRRRQFNIDNLTVSETESPDYSRITVQFAGERVEVNEIVDPPAVGGDPQDDRLPGVIHRLGLKGVRRRHDVPPAGGVIHLLRYGHEHHAVVILEGILYADWYRPLFEAATVLLQMPLFSQKQKLFSRLHIGEDHADRLIQRRFHADRLFRDQADMIAVPP